ncbi:MAG TPA: sigma factor [Candidatus Saccharimonadales bacterium]|nr:sigma factor [Candidatus Saccharimonadales bacterium]
MDHGAKARSDDPALIERIARRDPAALGELFDRYGRVVFGTLHQMLPSASAANEVCQEVFLQLWRAADSSVEHGTPVHQLLLRLTGTAATNWLRTHGRDVTALGAPVRAEAQSPA